MSVLETADSRVDNYADRRQDFRRPASRSAELVSVGDQKGYDCTILDESQGGVQVETSQILHLPDQMLIKFNDQAAQLVQRCWTSGTRAGYQYIEIVPARRRMPEDAPLASGEADLAALNDFIQISRTMLDLSSMPADWLAQADQIRALLAEMPHARLQLEHNGLDGRKVMQLFAIPQSLLEEPSGYRI